MNLTQSIMSVSAQCMKTPGDFQMLQALLRWSECLRKGGELPMGCSCPGTELLALPVLAQRYEANRCESPCPSASGLPNPGFLQVLLFSCFYPTNIPRGW